MKTIVFLVDTNVILRYLLNDHEQYSQKATDFFREVADGNKKIEIPSFVLAECVHVLFKFYKVSKEDLADILVRVLSLKGVMNKDRFELTNALLMFKDTKIDFADCLLAAYSTPERKIVSFDSDFNDLPVHREVL